MDELIKYLKDGMHGWCGSIIDFTKTSQCLISIRPIKGGQRFLGVVPKRLLKFFCKVGISIRTSKCGGTKCILFKICNLGVNIN